MWALNDLWVLVPIGSPSWCHQSVYTRSGQLVLYKEPKLVETMTRERLHDFHFELLLFPYKQWVLTYFFYWRFILQVEWQTLLKGCHTILRLNWCIFYQKRGWWPFFLFVCFLFFGDHPSQYSLFSEIISKDDIVHVKLSTGQRSTLQFTHPCTPFLCTKYKSKELKGSKELWVCHPWSIQCSYRLEYKQNDWLYKHET